MAPAHNRSQKDKKSGHQVSGRSERLIAGGVVAVAYLAFLLLRMPIFWYVAGVGGLFSGDIGYAFLFLGIGAILHLIFASRGA